MINWKNTAENLLLILIGIVFGTVLGFKVSVKTSNHLIEQLKPTIDKAIDKETIKNEIKNEIDLKIDKVKKSDSIHINVNQVPENDQEQDVVINNDNGNQCSENEVCVPVSTLSRKQKKLLGLLKK